MKMLVYMNFVKITIIGLFCNFLFLGIETAFAFEEKETPFLTKDISLYIMDILIAESEDKGILRLRGALNFAKSSKFLYRVFCEKKQRKIEIAQQLFHSLIGVGEEPKKETSVLSYTYWKIKEGECKKKSRKTETNLISSKQEDEFFPECSMFIPKTIQNVILFDCIVLPWKLSELFEMVASYEDNLPLKTINSGQRSISPEKLILCKKIIEYCGKQIWQSEFPTREICKKSEGGRQKHEMGLADNLWKLLFFYINEKNRMGIFALEGGRAAAITKLDEDTLEFVRSVAVEFSIEDFNPEDYRKNEIIF